MKKLFSVLGIALLLTACSEQEERNGNVGGDIAKKMKAPVEQTRAITDKINKSRNVDLPQ